MNIKYVLSIFVCLSPCFLSAVTYQVKHVIENPYFPGYPIKINNNGVISGSSFKNNYHDVAAFIYDSKNGETIFLDAFDGGDTRVLDINNNDEVVGFYSQEEFSPISGKQFYHVPFIYSKDKGFLSLKSTLMRIDSSTFSSHIEINDDGLLAGYGFIDSIFNYFSHKGTFRYGLSSLILNGKTAVVLNHPIYPLQKSVCVKSLNNNGDVAGGVFYGLGQDARIYKPAYAFMQDSIQKKILSLGNLGGEDKFYSCATDINDLKQVVGLSEVNIKNKQNHHYHYHAFLWNNGSMSDLGTLQQDTDSVAYAINTQGDIVGISGKRNELYSWSSGGAFKRAFIWSMEKGMIDLNDLIRSDSNYELLEAVDINDNGQIVCLAKKKFNYDYHIVLLNPE